jgi:hypothetical protein
VIRFTLRKDLLMLTGEGALAAFGFERRGEENRNEI